MALRQISNRFATKCNPVLRRWNHHQAAAIGASRTLPGLSNSSRGFENDPSSWSQALSFASPESDFTSSAVAPSPFSLPRTWAQALADTKDALVITTASAPHRIQHVNAAWEDLCGYTKDEALQAPASLKLIQGPETSTKLVNSTIDQVLADGKEQSIHIVNYKKGNQETFVNKLTLGTLFLDDEAPHEGASWLIGRLEAVPQSPLQMVAAA